MGTEDEREKASSFLYFMLTVIDSFTQRQEKEREKQKQIIWKQKKRDWREHLQWTNIKVKVYITIPYTQMDIQMLFKL